MLKPWLIFVKEHGTERIFEALVVVNLAMMSTAKKISQAYQFSLPESDARASFSSFVSSVPDCCCLFTGTDINYDHLHSAANMRCERSQA